MPRNNPDGISSLVLLALALWVCREAVGLGIGSRSDPGPGFVFIGCGFLLVSLSIIEFVRSFRRTALEDTEKTNWSVILLVSGALALYTVFFEKLGFLLATFLLMALLLRLGGCGGWGKALGVALVSSLGIYGVFQYWLLTRLPNGILSFLF